MRRVALVCYRLALRLAPHRVSAAHREEMTETFAAVCETAASSGPLAVMRVLAREIVDMLRARTLQRSFDAVDAKEAAAVSLSTAAGLRTRPTYGFDLGAWRQALRSIRHRPTFSFVVVLTLTLGTAVTTTIYAVVDSTLLAALPYPDGDRLVSVYEANPTTKADQSLVAPIRLEDWQRLNETFVALAATYSENVTDTSGTDPERLDGRRVTPRFFAVYGTPPLAGRTFTPDEERFGGPMAAVISEGLWTRRFGRDPSAIGRALTIGGTRAPIVGVMPRTFTPAAVDIWLPAQTSQYILDLRDARFLNGIGRMKPDVTIEQARQDLNRVQRALGEQFPKTDKDWTVRLQDLKAARITGQERPLWLVFAAVSLLWVIGIANVAALMVTEMRRRSRELAVRAAIGASRRQIVGAVMREVLILAAAGGTIGALLAAWLVTAVPATFTALPRISEIAFSGRAAAFAAATGIIAALLFGAWPAWHGTRGALAASISHGGRGGSAQRHRLQQTLVVAQVALSVVLAGSAMLLARTYVNLVRADAGFSADGAVNFHMGARWDEDRPKIGQLRADFVAGLEQLPGVEAAGFVNFLPMTGATLRSYVSVQGVAGPERDGTIMTGTRMIGGSYLRAMKIAIVSGEACPPLKMDFNAPRHALVNRRFVDLHASGQNLVGRDLRFAAFGDQYMIVGVVADVVEDGPGASVVPYVYTCQSAGSWPDPEYVVRGSDARAIIAGTRQLMKKLDPGRAIFSIRPLDDVVSRVLERPRVSAAMFGVFATSAVSLAALGLYSLFMLIVAEGTREIGVRLALGAAPGQVRRLVLGGAGRLCLLGIGVGLALSAAAQRLFGSLLFGVRPLDALTLGAATLALAAAAGLAIAIPAFRAGRVSPIVAMRAD